MASNTENLGLYKKDPVQDGDDTFNIETMLNENWDKIDGFAEEVENQLSNADNVEEAVNDLIEKIGSLDQLDTNIKSNLVAAVNSIYQKLVSHEAEMATQNTAGHIKLSDIPSPDLSAENISLDSENFTSDDVKGGMEELFQSVNSGKDLVRNAVVDMNQNVPSVPTFLELANAIMNISSDANATAMEVLSGRTFYQGGVKRAGTMPNRGSETITPNDSTQTRSAGYYSGITVNPRPNLTGNATAAHVLSGRTFYMNSYTRLTGSMANRTGHVNAQSHSRSGTTLRFRPQAGYYDGTSGNSVQRSDDNFIADNIKKGVSIFGLTGSMEEAKSANGVITLARDEDVTLDLPFDVNFALIHTYAHGLTNIIFAGVIWRVPHISGENAGSNGTTNRIYMSLPSSYKLRLVNNGGSTVWWTAFGFSDILIP